MATKNLNKVIEDLQKLEIRLGTFNADTRLPAYKADEISEIIVEIKNIRTQCCNELNEQHAVAA